MADWTIPSGAHKAYVPSGLGWRRAGESLRQWAPQFSAQMLAIKQWEAEKEAKQRQQELERQQFEALQNFRKWQQAEEIKDREQRMQIEQMKIDADKWQERFRASQKEYEDKIGDLTAEANKILATGMDVQTDLGDWFITEYSKAWNNQDLGRIQQLMSAAPQHSDKLKFVTTKTTTKGGEPTETQQPTQDLGIIRNVGQQLLTLGGQMGWKPKGGYGYPTVPEEQKRRPVMIALQAPDEATYQEVKNRAIRGGYPPEEWERVETEILAEMEGK